MRRVRGSVKENMPILKLKNTKFYYESHGTGHPLVLIAGYACDHTFWFPVLEELSSHFQVIIFDNRAIGQTKDHDESLTIELMADDLILLFEKLELKNPYIVGHSMGGMIARTLAEKYPKHISKLVIVTSSIKCREPAMFAFNTMLQMRKDNIDFDLIFQTMLPWIFSADFLKNKQNIELLKKSYLENPYPQSINDQARQYEVLKKYDGASQLQQIQQPTLIINGTQDIISLPRESQRMANQIPNSSLIELDCAHGIVAEIPKKLSQLLNEFLNANS